MIADAELAALKSYTDIVALAESFGTPPPKKEGRRFRTCCLWHSERTGSLVLYPDQGAYHCYGCGVNGDQVKMAMERLGCDFLGALRHLAKFSGYWPEGLTDADGKAQPKAVPAAPPKPRVTEDKRRRWHVVTPVPARVPAPRLGTFEVHLHSAARTVAPVRFWPYLDAAGQLLGCDVRYEYTKKPKDDIYRVDDLVEVAGQRIRVVAVDDKVLHLADGREILASAAELVVKDVITWTWCARIDDGTQEWRMRAWDDPAPLYGLDRLAAQPEAGVVICEGCKAADAGNANTGRVGMSWRGGSDTAVDFENNDWSPLAGRDVVIWPDADVPGHKAAWHIAQHLHRVGAARVRVVDTAGLPKGWDLADA